MSTVLIIESNDAVKDALVERLNDAGIEVASAPDLPSARSLMQQVPPSLVLLDVSDENQEPLAQLTELKKAYPRIPVIVTAALASTETAVEAMKLKAADFMLKPFSPEEVAKKAQSVLLHSTAGEREEPPPADAETWPRAIGQSRAIQDLLHLIAQIAPSDKPVLISGECGVGKSHFADQVHQSSHRRAKSLFVFNCSTLSGEDLVNRELFGFAQGAFEGANVPREGILVKADGGTVLFEEVGDLPLSAQARILNYLQTGEIRRLGEDTPIMANTRIIATTGKDLETEIDHGRFRADLYFRLKNIAFEIPPLQKRKEDIALLIPYFLKKLRRRGDPRYRTTKEALGILCSLPYPGNVRELKNLVEQIVLVNKKEVIGVQELKRAGLPQTVAPEAPLQKIALTEKEVVQEVIDRHPCDLEAAALELGLSRTTLWRRMKKYGLIRRD